MSEYTGPARLAIPCTCGAPSIWFVECTGSSAGNYVCDGCRQLLARYYADQHVTVRPLIVTVGMK